VNIRLDHRRPGRVTRFGLMNRAGRAESANKAVERYLAFDVFPVVVARNGEDGGVVVLVGPVELLIVVCDLPVEVDAVTHEIEERGGLLAAGARGVQVRLHAARHEELRRGVTDAADITIEVAHETAILNDRIVRTGRQDVFYIEPIRRRAGWRRQLP